MEEKIFMDKQQKPEEQTLKCALGDVFELYETLNVITQKYKKDWGFTKSGGWMLKVADSKKALFYLIPMKNEIKISMAIRESERDELLKGETFSMYNEMLLSAKKYTEGYALQFLLNSQEDFKDFESLLRALMSMRIQ